MVRQGREENLVLAPSGSTGARDRSHSSASRRVRTTLDESGFERERVEDRVLPREKGRGSIEFLDDALVEDENSRRVHDRVDAMRDSETVWFGVSSVSPSIGIRADSRRGRSEFLPDDRLNLLVRLDIHLDIPDRR